MAEWVAALSDYAENKHKKTLGSFIFASVFEGSPSGCVLCCINPFRKKRPPEFWGDGLWTLRCKPPKRAQTIWTVWARDAQGLLLPGLFVESAGGTLG